MKFGNNLQEHFWLKVKKVKTVKIILSPFINASRFVDYV